MRIRSGHWTLCVCAYTLNRFENDIRADKSAGRGTISTIHQVSWIFLLCFDSQFKRSIIFTKAKIIQKWPHMRTGWMRPVVNVITRTFENRTFIIIQENDASNAAECRIWRKFSREIYAIRSKLMILKELQFNSSTHLTIIHSVCTYTFQRKHAEHQAHIR